VSTRSEDSAPALTAANRLPLRASPRPPDPAELVARVALSRRDLLLRVHRHRLSAEDLEDCYSQATLELVQRARSGAPFASAGHVANALEQRFLSRAHDRRRALAGRSPMEAALGQAVSLDPPEGGGGDFADPGLGVVEQVVLRDELAVLGEIAGELTADMRLVLAHQVVLGTECQDFCQRFGWSTEKFRKVAQRARSKLLALSEEQATGARCRRLEPDLLAYVSRVAEDGQRERILVHLENCPACRRRARDLRAHERGLLGLLPGGLEAGVAGGVIGSTGGAAATGGGGVAIGAGVATWGSTGAVGLKIGVVAICLAGLAGGGAALCHGGALTGVFGRDSAHRPAAHAVVARKRSAVVITRAADLPAFATAMSAAAAQIAEPTPSATPTPASPTPSERRGVAEALAQREFGFGALAATEPQPTQLATDSPARIASRRRRRQKRLRAAAPRLRAAPLVDPGAASSGTSPPPPPPTAPPSRSSSGGPSSSGEFGFEQG